VVGRTVGGGGGGAGRSHSCFTGWRARREAGGRGGARAGQGADGARARRGPPGGGVQRPVPELLRQAVLMAGVCRAMAPWRVAPWRSAGRGARCAVRANTEVDVSGQYGRRDEMCPVSTGGGTWGLRDLAVGYRSGGGGERERERETLIATLVREYKESPSSTCPALEKIRSTGEVGHTEPRLAPRVLVAKEVKDEDVALAADGHRARLRSGARSHAPEHDAGGSAQGH